MNHEHSPLLFCFYTMHSQTFLKIAKKVLFKGKHLKTKMIPESVSLGINAVIIVLSRDDESGCKLVSMLSFVPGKHNRPVYILIVIHSIFSDSVDCGCTCLSLSEYKHLYTADLIFVIFSPQMHFGLKFSPHESA